MIPFFKVKNQRLVSGRAGELTNRANTLTFDLLEYIFGKDGPYRNTLRRFGIKLNPTSDSFLLLEDGEVFTDLDREEKILWGCYPIALIEQKGQVNHKFSWQKAGLISSINYLKKVIFDSKIITNIETHLSEAHNIYKQVSEKVVLVCSAGIITLEDFLETYESIISVSYLFELLDLYNVNKVSDEITRKYVKQNDYLLASDEKYVEISLKLSNGFYLDDYPDLHKKLSFVLDNKFTFIPHSIPSLEKTSEISKLRSAEIELQCLKNNLRLKTNILLYFLNLTALTNAKSRGISSIGDKKLIELF